MPVMDACAPSVSATVVSCSFRTTGPSPVMLGRLAAAIQEQERSEQRLRRFVVDAPLV